MIEVKVLISGLIFCMDVSLFVATALLGSETISVVVGSLVERASTGQCVTARTEMCCKKSLSQAVRKK